MARSVAARLDGPFSCSPERPGARHVFWWKNGVWFWRISPVFSMGTSPYFSYGSTKHGDLVMNHSDFWYHDWGILMETYYIKWDLSLTIGISWSNESNGGTLVGLTTTRCFHGVPEHSVPSNEYISWYWGSQWFCDGITLWQYPLVTWHWKATFFSGTRWPALVLLVGPS